MGEAVESLRLELDAIDADLRAARTEKDVERVRLRLVDYRRRYLGIETVLEFYGHAVRSRTTTRLAEMLRACDMLTMKSIDGVVRGVGLHSPPVLVYVDRGLGASILRAGMQLWGGGSPSVAAAVKVTRFNLFTPTSMLHEGGHQTAHLLDWNRELADAFRHRLGDKEVGAYCADCASEIAADTIAFAYAGYGSIAALHDVVAGDTAQVFRYVPGDPHPVAYLRVLIGTQMCVRFFGAGPWDDLSAAWTAVHPMTHAPPALRPLLERGVAQLERIVDVCLRTPMRAFGERPLAALVDPDRVSPAALKALRQEAGGALTTSSHWLREESLRLLALSSWDMATMPERADQITRSYEAWMRRLGALSPTAQAAAA
jgi:hypothetical protein